MPCLNSDIWLRFIAVLAMSALGACKLQIVTPPEGSVIPASGAVQCPAESSCEIDIDSAEFNEAFTGIPSPGFEFSHWRKAQGFICGDGLGACNLSTQLLELNPSWLAFLDAEVTVELEPVFQPIQRVAVATGEGAPKYSSLKMS